jgi:hypothetical protein
MIFMELGIDTMPLAVTVINIINKKTVQTSETPFNGGKKNQSQGSLRLQMYLYRLKDYH